MTTLRPAGRVEDLTREVAVQRPGQGLAAALDGGDRRRRAAQLLGAQYELTGPWNWQRDPDAPLKEQIDTELGRMRAIIARAEAGTAPAGPRQARPRRRVAQRPHRTGPLTPADRAFLLYQHDQEREATAKRRERIRRTAAQMRRVVEADSARR
jgi:hypothetical protein